MEIPFYRQKDSDTSSRWGTLQPHQVMLQDRIRTQGYHRAIERLVQPHHRVLDIGSGTGILSLFAAGKGCRKVCAVEHSEEMVSNARAIAAANGLADKIEFIVSDILSFKTREKFDVLLHEHLGPFVWDENMVAKVAYVRNNFLTPEAIMVPSIVDVYLAPIDYKSELEQSMDFWSNKVYGFDFRCLKMRHYSQKALLAVLPSIIDLRDQSMFLCEEKLLHSINLATASTLPGEISAEFAVKRPGILRGACGYFTASCAGHAMFSTRPARITTHWKQFFLPCFEQKRVDKGDTVRITINPAVKSKNWKFAIAKTG